MAMKMRKRLWITHFDAANPDVLTEMCCLIDDQGEIPIIDDWQVNVVTNTIELPLRSMDDTLNHTDIRQFTLTLKEKPQLFHNEIGPFSEILMNSG
jgi:hypothetical protein